MSGSKWSERIQEIIDVYEETQWRVDPVWVQLRDGVAALEAERDDLKARLEATELALDHALLNILRGRTDVTLAEFKAKVLAAAQQDWEDKRPV